MPFRYNIVNNIGFSVLKFFLRTEKRDFSCTICGTVFKAKQSLKRHMKKHGANTMLDVNVNETAIANNQNQSIKIEFVYQR